MRRVNVVITGAGGFIGSHLVERLARDDKVGRVYAVTGQARRSHDSENITAVKAKLGQIADLVFDEPVEVLVHLVAQWRTENASELTRVNVDGTRNAIQLCHRNGIGRIVFMSTANVLLRRPGGYAKSKLRAEKLVESSGLSYSILRSTAVYGQGDSGFSQLVRLIKAGVPVPVFGDGSALEQPIYIDELTELLAALVLDEGDSVIEAGGLQALSYRELLDELAGAVRKKLRVVHLPARLFIAGAALLTALYLPSPLMPEQIVHFTEDLVVENEWQRRFPHVVLRPVNENLEYVRAQG